MGGYQSVITFSISQSLCSTQKNQVSCHLNIIPCNWIWSDVCRLLRLFLNSMNSAEFETRTLIFLVNLVSWQSASVGVCGGASMELLSAAQEWFVNAQFHLKSGLVLPTAFEFLISIQLMFSATSFLIFLKQTTPLPPKHMPRNGCHAIGKGHSDSCV